MNVDSHWIEAIEHHVDSQIILQVINEMGLIKIVLNDESTLSCAILNDLLTITRQINTLPLRKTLWLDNIGFLFLYRFAIFINRNKLNISN